MDYEFYKNHFITTFTRNNRLYLDTIAKKKNADMRKIIISGKNAVKIKAVNDAWDIIYKQ